MDTITVNDDIMLLPLQEQHFDYLIPWNQDEEILKWVEEDEKNRPDEEEIKDIYREACAHGKCFLIVSGNVPIGECWLHELDFPELSQRFPDSCMYRIDYMIGERAFHGKGIGSTVVKALLRYGFETLGADVIWGFTKENNFASKRILQKAGFILDEIICIEIREKTQKRYQYRMTKAEYRGCRK